MREHSTILPPSPAASPVVYSFPEIDSTGVAVDDDANVMQRAASPWEILDDLTEISFKLRGELSAKMASVEPVLSDERFEDSETYKWATSILDSTNEPSDDLEFISDEVAAEFGNLMMIHRHNLKAAESRVVYLEREVLDLDLQIRELVGQLKDAKSTHKDQVEALAEAKDMLERLANSLPTMDDARRGVEKKTKLKRGAA